MKKRLLLYGLLPFIFLFGLTLNGRAQILYEGFDYATPAFIGGNGAPGSTSNNWTTHSVTTGQTTTIDIQDVSLAYSGLASSVGNKVLIFGNANATSRDVNRAFTTTATTVYYSALITIVDNSQITATGDYFLHFGATAGTAVTTFGARLGAKSANSGANFRFMILNTSGGTPAPGYVDNGTDLAFGTTYLVVVKYDAATSPTIASMWVNPTSLGGTEPAGAITNNLGTSTFSAFASICLRNNATTPKALVDEIRVGTTYADVTPTGGAVTSISVNSPVGGDQWRQGTTHNIVWSATGTSANVMIEFSANASAGTPTWSTLNPSIAASTGTWAWAIPASQPLSSDCKIRITDLAPNTATGISGIFSIVLPPTEVSTLAELRAGTAGTIYKYTGQSILTFKQTFRKQKYVQDATAAILIDDNNGKITTTYNLGDAITNLTGTVAVFNGMTQFTPESDPGAATSTGNTVNPEIVTIAQLNANWENYEAELIKIPNVNFTSPTGNFANGVIYPVTDIAGTGANFRTTFYDVDYINTAVPVVREDLVVIPNSRVDGDHITSRSLADFVYNTSNDIMISEIMYNPPDGGNDTIEFVELYNKGAVSVNMKDWYFSKGMTYVFPDIDIPALSYYVVARDAISMQHTFGITCAQWTDGFLDDSGEPIVLKDALGQVKDSVNYLPTAPWPTTPNNGGPSLTFCNTALDNSLGQNWAASTNQVAVNGTGQPIYASPATSCSSGAHLVMTEIMYNSPESGTDSLEFIELYNAGTALNIEGFNFSEGVVFTFPSYTLGAGQYVLVSANSSAIQHTFGKTSLQWTSGALTNTGETITLRDNYNSTVDQVTYSNAAPWPTLADGHGPSLSLCDPASNNALAEFWKASSEFVTKNAAGDSIFATPLGGCINPPTIADFSATPVNIIEGQSVQFHDLSTNNPTAWEWTFTGGNPSTSTVQNPLVQYNTHGLYSVTLKATNAYGNNTITKTDFINVGVDGISILSSSVRVYPNPTNGRLFITNPSKGLQEIAVFSVVGNQVTSLVSSEDIISLDISSQTRGLYLIKITNKANQSVQVKKVILY